MAASLERIAPDSQAALAAADSLPPRERIVHVFERLEHLEPVHDFRGCPFVAAAVNSSPRSTRRAWAHVDRRTG